MKQTFQSKANRDREATALRLTGVKVRCSSQRNVILSPDYVEDYTGIPAPNGFGGAAPEMFSVVYTLTEVRA